MFRKLSTVAVAVASLGVAALAPTSASAWGGGWYGGYHSYRHGWWGPHYYLGAPVSYDYGSCYVRQLLPTPWDPAGGWSTAATEIDSFLT